MIYGIYADLCWGSLLRHLNLGAQPLLETEPYAIQAKQVSVFSLDTRSS